MATLNPYLFFNGNCREVMNYYKDILGGTLELQTVGESPVAAQMPDKKDQVLHCMLTSGSIIIMASDKLDKADAHNGNMIDLCLVCESKEELDTLFEKLLEGGAINMPLKDEFFGRFGSVIDKYGIKWMLQYSKDNK